LLHNVDLITDWVIVGRFGRPHGIKGLITVVSFTEPRDNILSYTHWHAHINKQWEPLTLLHLEMNNKFILARVEGYNEREDVTRLTNIDIAVSRKQLPALPEGEYYWEQLLGMSVVNQQGTVLGSVEEMLSTGANDVLVVVGEKRHLIPYLPGRCVVKVNEHERVITVDWDTDF